MSSKIIKKMKDAAGNEIVFNSGLVVDESSGKTVGDAIANITTAVNLFLSGEPDDNGKLDRLKELVAAIESNKDLIEAATGNHSAELTALENRLNAKIAEIEAASARTSIAFVASEDAEPVFDGKLVMVVSDFTPATA